MTSPSKSLAIAELAISLALMPAMVYCLIKHGRHGIFAWIFLIAFAGLQLAAAGISLGSTASSGTSIIGSIGLSPLLLAALGVLIEADYRLSLRTSKATIVVDLFLHITTVSGVALSAIGASNLSTDTTDTKRKNDSGLWKAGATILSFVWLSLIAFTIVLIRRAISRRQASPASTLIWAAALALPLIGIRTLYGLIFAFTQKKSLSPATDEVAVKVLLVFLPQLLATLFLLAGGIETRNIATERFGDETELPQRSR